MEILLISHKFWNRSRIAYENDIIRDLINIVNRVTSENIRPNPRQQQAITRMILFILILLFPHFF